MKHWLCVTRALLVVAVLACLTVAIRSQSNLGTVTGVVTGQPNPDFAFARSSATGFGALGRNTARAPGFVNFNLSVFRKFRLTEGDRLEVRAEAFNAFNHPSFGPPQRNIDNYAAAGGNCSIELAGGAYAASRYDPGAGADVALADVKGGVQSFTLSDGQDWVIRLRRKTAVKR